MNFARTANRNTNYATHSTLLQQNSITYGMFALVDIVTSTNKHPKPKTVLSQNHMSSILIQPDRRGVEE